MGFTQSQANTILQNLFSGAYIALSTTTPSSDETGVTEPSGKGYERAAASGGSFTSDKGIIKNKAYVYFPEATGSWGTITHMCLYTAKTNGTLKYFGALNSAVSVGENTVPLFKPETISIALDAD